MCPLSTMCPHPTTTTCGAQGGERPATNSTVCGRRQFQHTHITIYVSSYCYICGAQGGGERPGTLPPRQRHATSTSAHTAYSPDQAACNYSRELQSGEPEPPRDYDLRRHELVRVLCRIDSLETSCLLGLSLLFSVFCFFFCLFFLLLLVSMN